MPSLPRDYDSALQRAWTLANAAEGHLSAKEGAFLFLAAAVPTTRGEILEIGSFKGRSTILLARGARLSERPGVVAVDPLCSPGATDPDLHGADSAEPDYRANLARAGVAEEVEHHRCLSWELAPRWNRPLRLLWIDGDHSREGASRDVRGFAPWVEPGGILALHDVLHRTPGPLRVVMEELLLSPEYGACGLVGSIFWTQRLRRPQDLDHHRIAKLRCWKRLARLLPYTEFKDRRSWRERKLWRLARLRVPHGPVDPHRWLRRLDPAPAE